MTNKIAGWIVKDSCLEVIDAYIHDLRITSIHDLRITSRSHSVRVMINMLRDIRMHIEQIKTEYEE